MRSGWVAGVVVAALAGSSAGAQAPVPVSSDQVIAIRQAMMELQQGVATAMKGAVDRKETNLASLKDAAEGLEKSTQVIPSLFPVGTEKGNGTKARPEIWSDQAGFQQSAQNATAAARKVLAAIEANDPAAFATSFTELGRDCGACHRGYRYRQ